MKAFTALLLVAAAACGGSAGDMTPTEARNELVARELMSAWAAGDTATFTELFQADAVYDDYAGQAQHQGIGEIVSYLTGVQTWATGVSVDVGAVHTSEHGATVEWVFTGIQDKPIGDRVPVATGRDVVLNGVTVLEIEKGRITHAADYIDELPLLLQLGAEVHMPGGAVIRLDDVLPPVDSTGGRP